LAIVTRSNCLYSSKDDISFTQGSGGDTGDWEMIRAVVREGDK
jgi:hypothetical protein